ncbi:MAG: 4-(cytidine 5'-diphospho)-2-C-methyl-D-erythritol kinase [Ignavibacteriae bacterium]|nr:MAG: 4-(cytidine 5'-diphospho)-2-C-methyl-D-erythritol kinase [Ignavibacteriota bacterium]
MKLRAYAKINIGLHILGKRSDGYHDLETIFHEINCFDELELEQHSKITMTADSILVPVDGSNLCLKAANLLQKEKHVKRGVIIHLKKNIPIGAGLGGGSSDAAAVLRGLNLFWELKLSDAQLRALAEQIGSDVPFFIEGGTASATGRGEILEPFSLPMPYWIAVVTPLIHISTAWAYQHLEPGRNGTAEGYQAKLVKHISNPKRLASLIHNDFEQPVFQTYPELNRIKEQLNSQGAVFSLMSGSGSTMVGFFDQEKKALGALESFPKTYQTSITAPSFKSHHEPEAR